jgi:hypothetical protein
LLAFPKADIERQVAERPVWTTGQDRRYDRVRWKAVVEDSSNKHELRSSTKLNFCTMTNVIGQ